MINEYSKGDQNESTVCPKPLYYDSYYYAGDDMLQELIREIFLTDKDSALVARLEQTADGMQKIKDFFGHNYNGQSISQRILRKNFNIQVLIPLACYYLELLKNQNHDCVVHFDDVFKDSLPNHLVMSVSMISSVLNLMSWNGIIPVRTYIVLSQNLSIH